MIKNILLVGFGGAIGAMLRYGVTLIVAAVRWSSNWATFIVNVVGSLAIGVLMSACQQSPWLLFATVGICGGFTTFSTFSMQSLTLFQQGRYGMACLYMLGTLVVCVVFAAIGYWVGQKLCN